MSKPRKVNMICPIKGCNYSSRTFINSSFIAVKDYNTSTTCPIHQRSLISVGNLHLPRKEVRTKFFKKRSIK